MSPPLPSAVEVLDQRFWQKHPEYLDLQRVMPNQIALRTAAIRWIRRVAFARGRLATSIALLQLLGCGASIEVSRSEPDGTSGGSHAARTARVIRAIAAFEYHATRTNEGLQAPNRRHDLRVWFEPNGIRIHDRTPDGAAEVLDLSLVAFGRSSDSGSRVDVIAPGTVSNVGPRVEIERPELVEWYVNSEKGLEQGFTVVRRPSGRGPLVLELALERATAVMRGDGVVFQSTSGRKIAYDHLMVDDANGVRLASRIELRDSSRVRIVVEDELARYPLTIDPLLSEAIDSQLEANQSAAELGCSVAGAGDVNGDGYADVIVGARAYDSGQTDEGAAFIFHGGVGGIGDANPATAATQLESDQASANFGFSVSSAGDVNGDGFDDVVVGSVFHDAGQTDEGAAFVFLGSSTGVADSSAADPAVARLESNQAGAWMGYSVGRAGDVNGDGYSDVLIGALTYDAGEADEGAAFLFLGGPSGIASGNPTTAATRFESNQASAEFAHSVASAGDVNGDGLDDVILGSRLYDSGQLNEGAAFVFLGSAAGIANGGPVSAHATFQSDQALARMGTSVSGAGDVNGDGYSDVIVGARFYDAGNTDEGSAFVFHGSPSGLGSGGPNAAHARLQPDQANAEFGWSVAGAGDVNADGYADVIVGAYLYDGGNADEGAAFVFTGGTFGVGDGNPSDAFAQLEANQFDAWVGYGVAGAGDVNGDGYADVLVGARFFDSGQTNEGAAFVFHGENEGLEFGGDFGTPNGSRTIPQAGAGTGWTVSGAGDVNRDGLGDWVVGVPFFDGGEVDEGAIYIERGGYGSDLAVLIQSNVESMQFGWSVSDAGDVNGDGFSDVAASALGSAVFVFHGSASGLVSGDLSRAATRIDAGAGPGSNNFGYLVSSAGDVNGDGYGDLIIGSPRHQLDPFVGTEGAAFIHHGSPIGIRSGTAASTAQTQLRSGQVDSRFGYVTNAGDVNGDGFGDVAVGAIEYDAGQSNEGAVFVYLGAANGIPSGTTVNASATIESNLVDGKLGAVSNAGDVNGDGFGDLIVGVPGIDTALIFHGGPSGVVSGNPSTAATRLTGPTGSSFAAVSAAGDLNADGFSDVAIGAPLYSNGQSEEGAVFIFSGASPAIPDSNATGATRTIESNSAGAQFGAFVSPAGDPDRPDSPGIIVGAPGLTVTTTFSSPSAGGAFLYAQGPQSDRREPRLGQLRGDGSGIRVQPWGGSWDPDAFEVTMRAWHPQGRGRVKLEVEACPAGSAFGAPPCTVRRSDAWADTLDPGHITQVNRSVDGLTEGTLYRWRARVLFAPSSVTKPGITPPPHPAHGPWLRPTGQGFEGDIRIVPEPSVSVMTAVGIGLVAIGSRSIRGRRQDPVH